jgi:putative endonuclease
MLGRLYEALVIWRDRRKALGPRGETVAAIHLRRAGYRLIRRNLGRRFGEVDLLAEAPDRRTIVIVEVKATVSEHPPPEVHVNPTKQRKLAALAPMVVRSLGLADRPVRFDVVGVVWPDDQARPSRLTHHIGAFEAR